MGEAKRRGERSLRISQAIERRKVEEARREKERLRVKTEEKEQIRNLPEPARKEAVMRKQGLALTMAAAAAALAFPVKSLRD